MLAHLRRLAFKSRIVRTDLQVMNSTNRDANQAHQHGQQSDQQQPAYPKDKHQTIIASVERPNNTQTNHQQQQQQKPSIPTNMKQSSNSRTIQAGDDNESATNKNAVIISQLQQLQSPPPQPTSRDSPITQVNKSRHRGFLSQLLCCFRPASSNLYHESNSIYNNADATQHHNNFTQKYSGKYLLPVRKPSDNRICLVIDLDETLVHSSFKPIENADFIVPVEIDGTLHKVYVLKRPHVDEFLKRMGRIYECVLFTASLAKYADPVADLLDKESIFKARLFRESCAFYRGNYVKDLSRLGRDLSRVIIIDNSPASYIFHPDNAVSLITFILIAV